MFDIGWSELLVIAVVAIVVIGPKDLPRMMRSFGRFTGNLRRAAADFQRQFDEAVRDTEIDEVRQAMQDFHSTARSADLKAELDKPLMTEAPPQAAAGPAALPPPQAETAVTPPKRKRKPAAPRAAKPKPQAVVAQAETNASTETATQAAPKKRPRKKATP